MEILFSCSKCIDDKFNKREKQPYQLDAQYETINGSGFYDYTCTNGHRNIVVLQDLPFELLFQSAIVLLCNGYFRESVFNFAASLERFLEFCVKAFVFSKQHDFDLFDETWKGVSRQSERQIGAFYFLYLNIVNEPPQIIDDKMSRLRNDVIHKGEFISKHEAERYGKFVYDYINSTRKKLESKVEKQWNIGMGRAVDYHLKQVFKSINNRLKDAGEDTENQLIQTTTIPTYVSISRPLPTSSFEEIIADYISYHVKLMR